MKSPKTSSKKLSPDAGSERAKLRLSSSAQAELDAIDTYSFEQFGADIADAYMRDFEELFDLLRRHPKAGMPAPELGKGIRKLTHRQHRIFYTVEGDLVFIARIMHHAMDARRALKEASR
jgi:toxin ParE1/3/4